MIALNFPPSKGKHGSWIEFAPGNAVDDLEKVEPPKQDEARSFAALSVPNVSSGQTTQVLLYFCTLCPRPFCQVVKLDFLSHVWVIEKRSASKEMRQFPLGFSFHRVFSLLWYFSATTNRNFPPFLLRHAHIKRPLQSPISLKRRVFPLLPLLVFYFLPDGRGDFDFLPDIAGLSILDS